jgi:tetratricopeptide (TPR) repeat protein
MTGLFSREPKDPQEKKYAEALKSGRDYLHKMPHNHDVLFTVGGIYYLQKKYKTAISYFEKALEIGTYDVDVLLLKAYSHQKLGENKRAIQCCEKIQEIDPKNKSVSNLLEELN